MADSTTLMPVKLPRRRGPRVSPPAQRKTHALPQTGKGINRTLCGRAIAGGVTMDDSNPTCKRCTAVIARQIAEGVDVSVVTGEGIVTINGIELPVEGG